jgi:hypothetical protein
MFTFHKTYKVSKETKGTINILYWGLGLGIHLYCNNLPLGSRYHQYGFSSLEQTIGNFATFTTVVMSVILLLEMWLSTEHIRTVQ